MDPAIEDLINSINFELDPVYVIRTIRDGSRYFLREMDFLITHDNLIRKRYWTCCTGTALKFYSYDEISNFIKHQMIDTHCVIHEVIQ